MKRILCFLLVIISMNGSLCLADQNISESFRKQKESIVRIESICWDGEAEIFEKRLFSGFVIAPDPNNIYVITVHNQLTYSLSDKEQIKKEHFNENENNAHVSEKLEIVFQGDVRVSAELIGESEQRNLAVLKLKQNVSFGEPLILAKRSVSDKKEIFLLSFPQKTTYNSEHVTITAGIADHYYKSEDIIYMKHDLNVEKASLGGPILNRDGYVTGVLLSTSEEGGKAISCEELKDFLNTFHISFQEYEDEASEEEQTKLPILNVVLGLIILILIILISRQLSIRNNMQTGNHHKQQKKQKHKGTYLEFVSTGECKRLSKSLTILGRGEDATIRIFDPYVARKQAQVMEWKGNYYIRDLGSKNHTNINGKAIQANEKIKLNDLDQITMGKVSIIFHQ